ncbi:hypothetical protein BCR43DRAFT_488069 [Syncephalastrum racemosum]|uniref:Uncharacterized protein n=1 Tax=Syncephalastrum racemosum TaxID=13706 RepID=A0A1X2HI13_SYNRA|nr:hypothetical protein BCR43DRAFT_488069 [Syncephalastrum racemosum]
MSLNYKQANSSSMSSKHSMAHLLRSPNISTSYIPLGNGSVSQNRLFICLFFTLSFSLRLENFTYAELSRLSCWTKRARLYTFVSAFAVQLLFVVLYFPHISPILSRFLSAGIEENQLL